MTAPRTRRALALWADWCAATGRDPTTRSPETLERFAADVPDAAPAVREALLARRSRPGRRRRDDWQVVEHHWGTVRQAWVQCPVYGWPLGVAGRRDAFLITMVRVLRMPRDEAVALRGMSVSGLFDRLPVEPVDGVCTRCVAHRWLVLVAINARWSRASLRNEMYAAPPPPRDTSQPTRRPPPRPLGSARACDGSCSQWPATAEMIGRHHVLVPAIDRHGWWKDWRPMSPRALTTVLATRCDAYAPAPPPDVPAGPPVPATNGPRPTFDEHTLDRLDDLVKQADEANERVEALLREFETAPGPIATGRHATAPHPF